MSENIKQKSAAEFFCEHQQIAGFDNPGKSLFTSIRELVENSLDAAESISVLPDISLKIVEYTEDEHNSLHGIKKKSKTTVAPAEATPVDDAPAGGNVAADSTTAAPTPAPAPTATPTSAAKTPKGKASASAARSYYKIVCRDNGCGMAAADIGNLLGRVLSGSKHGIKQTRGKFGLGAKMALIWSKKSSGLPIEIASCTPTTPSKANPNPRPNPVTVMVLDMDIYRNEPSVVSCRTVPNEQFCAAVGVETAGRQQPWHGTEISITISGSWTNYKARVLQYFQQLAVITPYAEIAVSFQANAAKAADAGPSRRDFVLHFHRRSEQMPPIAREILPHPSALNHITLTKLLQDSKYAKSSLRRCLTGELSGINGPVADKILASLMAASAPTPSGSGASSGNDIAPCKMTTKHVTALSQILRDEKSIRPPSHVVTVSSTSQLATVSASSCLSPVGEYNLRLGIIKELRPRLIATYSDASAATSAASGSHHYEGHPFVVEAAVALGSHSQAEDATSGGADTSGGGSGGSAKEQQYGIHIYRFANRIPLLFETGADVITQVATKHIQWGSYLIDPKKDNIGVFVSIVSTKIPYKGTSKEYIGADVAEIHKAVKHAIQACCQQLRVQLQKNLKLRQEQERKKTLMKYVPDICNALHGILVAFKQQQGELEEAAVEEAAAQGQGHVSPGSARKRGRGGGTVGAGARAGPGAVASASSLSSAATDVVGGVPRKMLRLLGQLDEGKLTAATLSECLAAGVKRFDEEAQALQCIGSGAGASSASSSSGSASAAAAAVAAGMGMGNLSMLLSTAASTRADITALDSLFLNQAEGEQGPHADFDAGALTFGTGGAGVAGKGSGGGSILLSQETATQESFSLDDGDALGSSSSTGAGGAPVWVPVSRFSGKSGSGPSIYAHFL